MELRSKPSAATRGKSGFTLMLTLLAGVLILLFYGCFLPGHTLFSNDGPLATQVSQCHKLPEGFKGTWEDLNIIGSPGPGFLVSITYIVLLLLGPVWYAKVYAPFALLLLGLGAWRFFRKLGLSPVACILGALAATLNSIYFSTACWGVAGHPLAVGMSLFALSFLVDPSPKGRWRKMAEMAAAGLAVGAGVADGTDVGGIFSMFVAVFAIYWAIISEGPVLKNLGNGLARLAVVVLFAVFFAWHAISVVPAGAGAGGVQNKLDKAEQWNWATQWSLPKREALSIIIPGLFGYRMDAPKGLPEYLQEHLVGAEYWGAAGRDPAWDRYFASDKSAPPPNRFIRYSGGGPYAGILVALVGVWAAIQACRKRDSVFTLSQQKHLWFWIATAVVSLLLAFGRFAPFYQFLFPLPYFHSIRNPAKFLEFFSLALIVLFAHGVDALDRRGLAAAPSAGPGGFKAWWARAARFDRWWVLGCIATFAMSLGGWFIYAAHRAELERYLQTVQFDEVRAHEIAGFSINQVGWFLIFLAVAVVLFTTALSGRFAGPHAKWAGVLLGVFLVVDLGRADLPWIIFVDYKDKNATNPVIDLLRQQPYEHRVAILPFRASSPQYAILDELYGLQWAQHQFQYYNIQSLDLVQMPRMPEDLAAFETALHFDNSTNTLYLVPRRWQLTNTRYLLGAAGFLNVLNQQLDPLQHSFRIRALFNIGLKPGLTKYTQETDLTAAFTTNGPFALFEFTGALPRAKLYTRWQVNTNDQATLDTLASPQFDPEQMVLVSTPIPDSTAGTNAGNVSFVSYAPRDIKFKAEAAGPSVLLLNDRFDANWKVFVDGKVQPLLRCNFIMRGVQVPTGQHQVEFRFEPPVGALYISVAAVLVGIGLVGYLLFTKHNGQPEQKPQPTPAREKPREKARA
jgi:hypothetical protein